MRAVIKNAGTLRYAAIGGLAIVLMWFWSASIAAAADVSERAEAFIVDLSDKAVATLANADISDKERIARFRSLLNESFELDTIGRWVLGRYWRQATPEQQEEYLKLFEELIIVTYANRFKRYSGERLAVEKVVVDSRNGDPVVFSKIQRPRGGEPIDVGWRLRDQDGTLKIVDVIVEGISMSQTQRQEYNSFIRNNGGEVQALLDEMRTRVQQNAS